MNPKTLVGLGIVSCLLYASVLDYLAETKKKSAHESFRTHEELCLELSETVSLSVEAELLTREEADQIINRCHQLK